MYTRMYTDIHVLALTGRGFKQARRAINTRFGPAVRRAFIALPMLRIAPAMLFIAPAMGFGWSRDHAGASALARRVAVRARDPARRLPRTA